MTTRRLYPAEILLAQIDNTYPAFTDKVMKFTVPTPDARLSVRISLVFRPDPLWYVGPYDIFGMTPGGARMLTYALWLAAAVKDNGAFLPVTNLLGTMGAPGLIPDTGGLPVSGSQSGPGLLGYSQTVVADCDAVTGEFHVASLGYTIGAVTPPFGKWFLVTRYQAVRGLCDDEWSELVPQCSPSLSGNPWTQT